MTGPRHRSERRARSAAASLLGALVLVCAAAPCRAESGYGSESASARLRITVVVPPVLRVLQVTPVADGYTYRVWTNMRWAFIGARAYRFDHVGESTVHVPAAPGDAWIVHGL